MDSPPAAPDRPVPSPALASRLPGARASLVLLLVINLFNYIDRYVLAAAEPLIRKEFFKDDDPHAKGLMGLLATAFLVSYMVTAPIFGWLGDRWRRWAIIGAGVIAWSLASGASGLAAGFAMLLVTRIFVGIGEAAYGPVAPTIISDLYPISRRGAVLAWFYMAIPVGSAIGYVLGGFVGAHWGWRCAFYIVVAPGILLGFWCFIRPEPARGGADGPAGDPSRAGRKVRIADYAVLLRTPSYVLNTAGMTMMTFAVGGMSFWMPTYVHEFRDQPDLGKVSTIFGGVTVVGGLAGTLLGGYLADRLRTRMPGSYFLVAGAGMLLAFPAFLGTLYMPYPWAWVWTFFAIVFLFLGTGPTNTIVANVTHPAMRATAFAALILVIHALGDAISPPLIGWVTDLTKSAENPRGNMNTGFMTVSAAILLSGVFWLWGARHLERDTALAGSRIPA